MFAEVREHSYAGSRSDLSKGETAFARQDDDRAACPTEQEVLVLSEKHHLIILKSFTDASVRRATPSECDDMLRRQAIVLQAAEQPERKVLVEEDDHDA